MHIIETITLSYTLWKDFKVTPLYEKTDAMVTATFQSNYAITILTG